ncbi:L-lactate dehydrogenase-like [Aphidius gifuensis]|uniref:L-lactate dehydrogenase-like n=1 Tax=Aphidius gifuensis TaxID=684658 RepID=UPI001CDBF71E|nr:L-lactate dehydrogenase-like [Aphidius gifuensis]
MSDEDNQQVDDKKSKEPIQVDRGPITTTTKNALITTQLSQCDIYPNRLKVSIVGIGNVGIACAITILMRRIASEVCLIDKNASRAKAEAEDIRHAGIFLGNPLVTGTSDITMVKDSTVVIISIGDNGTNEKPNLSHNLEIFKKVIPAVSKFACHSILLVATRPIDVMSYITWKFSKFPSNRVLGTGTLLDTMKLQCQLGQRLGIANTSVNCLTIGGQGDTSVPIWSGVHVGGIKLRDINPKIGDKNDPERWYEMINTINNNQSNIWCLGICTAEIVDAIIRNTKVVLPVSTYIHTCVHGTDKDVYMSVPCVLGREGVHHTVRQKLTDQEKSFVQTSADGIRNILRDCGILELDEST